ncbi:signal peptidase I [Pasteuria penetrans]|uniref:signal peptidase I n=1 Tax=Pasteuria penetrans TaxID=86005 RepID=UPI000FB717CE|nr:signal peptidase I [Pasteuria penetrans]
MKGGKPFPFLLLAIVGVSIVVIRLYVVSLFVVDGRSMFPTLTGGEPEGASSFGIVRFFEGIFHPSKERVLVSRLSDPERCDVVVFHPPGSAGDLRDEDYEKMDFVSNLYYKLPFIENHRFFIKRVLAVGGDRVAIRDSKVIVNGIEQDDSYTMPTRKRENAPEREVPQGHVFLMGDNRGNSVDSRQLGFIPLEEVQGVALAVFWPWDDRFGSLRSSCSPG